MRYSSPALKCLASCAAKKQRHTHVFLIENRKLLFSSCMGMRGSASKGTKYVCSHHAVLVERADADNVNADIHQSRFACEDRKTNLSENGSSWHWFLNVGEFPPKTKLRNPVFACIQTCLRLGPNLGVVLVVSGKFPANPFTDGFVVCCAAESTYSYMKVQTCAVSQNWGNERLCLAKNRF